MKNKDKKKGSEGKRVPGRRKSVQRPCDEREIGKQEGLKEGLPEQKIRSKRMAAKGGHTELQKKKVFNSSVIRDM